MSDPPSNPYIFGDPTHDRARLDTQTKLLGRYLTNHALDFFGSDVHTILDVGCGEGQLGLDLLRIYAAAHLVGVDRDAAAVAQAGKSAATQGLNARFEVGDVQQALPAGPYDLALASLLLLHTTQPAQVLQHIYAQLRSGGSLLVIDLAANLPAMESFGSAYQRLISLLYTAMTRMGVHPLIMDELPGLLEQSGFVDYTRRETAQDHPMIANDEIEVGWAQAVGIATIYNARMGISAATGIPVSTIERLVADVILFWSTYPILLLPPVYAVATARKP